MIIDYIDLKVAVSQKKGDTSGRDFIGRRNQHTVRFRVNKDLTRRKRIPAGGFQTNMAKNPYGTGTYKPSGCMYLHIEVYPYEADIQPRTDAQKKRKQLNQTARATAKKYKQDLEEHNHRLQAELMQAHHQVVYWRNLATNYYRCLFPMN